MTMMVMMICRYFCSVRTVDVSMWTLSAWLPDWLAGWWCCCCCFVCHCRAGQRCSKRKFFFKPGKLCFSFFSFRLLHQQQQQQQQLITSNSGGPIAVPSPLLAQFAQLLSVCLFNCCCCCCICCCIKWLHYWQCHQPWYRQATAALYLTDHSGDHSALVRNFAPSKK